MADIRHIRSLDGLRGLAASLVVVTHIEPIFREYGTIAWGKVGEQGVAIFFALSGFLMAYLYGGTPLTRAAGADYLVHRFARIYPVYLFAVLLAAVLAAWPGLGFAEGPLGAVEIARHVFMMGSSGVFWSIPPEIQFYLFFLLLWQCFAQPRRHIALIAAIACLFGIAAILRFPGPGILLVSKLPYFLFGAIAGRIYALQPRIAMPVGVGIAAWVMLALFVPSRVLGILPKEYFWGMPSAAAAAILVYLVACEQSLTAKFFTWAPLRFAGMVSFSLYLLHLPVMFLLHKWLAGVLPLAAVVAISIVASYAVAWLSYRSIEKPSRHFLVALWRNRRQGFVAAKA